MSGREGAPEVHCEVQGGSLQGTKSDISLCLGGKCHMGAPCAHDAVGLGAAEGLCRVRARTGGMGVALLAQEGGHGQHRLYSVLAPRHTSRVMGVYTGVY